MRVVVAHRGFGQCTVLAWAYMCVYVSGTACLRVCVCVCVCVCVFVSVCE